MAIGIKGDQRRDLSECRPGHPSRMPPWSRKPLAASMTPQHREGPEPGGIVANFQAPAALRIGSLRHGGEMAQPVRTPGNAGPRARSTGNTAFGGNPNGQVADLARRRTERNERWPHKVAPLFFVRDLTIVRCSACLLQRLDHGRKIPSLDLARDKPRHRLSGARAIGVCALTLPAAAATASGP